jgi:hypothetical protein
MEQAHKTCLSDEMTITHRSQYGEGGDDKIVRYGIKVFLILTCIDFSNLSSFCSLTSISNMSRGVVEGLKCCVMCQS